MGCVALPRSPPRGQLPVYPGGSSSKSRSSGVVFARLDIVFSHSSSPMCWRLLLRTWISPMHLSTVFPIGQLPHSIHDVSRACFKELRRHAVPRDNVVTLLRRFVRVFRACGTHRRLARRACILRRSRVLEPFGDSDSPLIRSLHRGHPDRAARSVDNVRGTAGLRRELLPPCARLARDGTCSSLVQMVCQKIRHVSSQHTPEALSCYSSFSGSPLKMFLGHVGISCSNK